MKKSLRVLIVEDSEEDATLIRLTLIDGGYEIVHTVVDTPAAMRAALKRQDWDVITSDHAMPHFNAPAALALAKKLCPDVPFIIVSGEIDLNLAVSLIKAGAQDYIQKLELSRLVPMIEHLLLEVEIHRDRQQIKDSLDVSEMRYRRLFETAQDGILILEANTGQILDVNPFMMDMLDYSKKDFLGKHLWEIGAFRDIETSKNAFQELQKKGYVRYEDMPLETSSGRHIAVEFISNIYSVNQTKVAQCNIRDITVRKYTEAEIFKLNSELEQRVQERTAQLEDLNRELETFSYSVSHDLHAPLRWIKGYADSLRDEYSKKQSVGNLQLIEKIHVSVQRMNDLINALLQLAHLSQRKIKRDTVDLSAIVHRVTADMQKNDPTRKVEFSIVEGITTNADEQLLLIVMNNLLGNSWKFTGRRVSAHIEFGTVPQADGTMIYFVRDNGAGFDMSQADRLFGPFQRLHSEKEFSGIGIGLATVQRIIHRHAGRIWAESKVNRGATFYFTLTKA